MTPQSTMRLVGVALLVSAFFAAPIMAQNSGSQSGQTPPAEAKPTPMPDPGTTSQLNCIAEAGKYDKTGNRLSYVIELQNLCEARMKCAVFFYQVGSKGPSSGRATMILAPKAKGAASKKSFAVKVKSVDGFSIASRECKVI